MLDRGMAPDKQLTLPFARQRGEAPVGASGGSTPSDEHSLMERVVERPNLFAALARVKTNGGSPGVDGMPVEDVPGHLQPHGPALRTSLLAGTYHPSPVRRVEIPKPGGGVRKLGIPPVLDRFLQQALLHVLQPVWDPTFSDHSYGFRPQRSAHQAVARTQHYLAEGYDWVGDLDLAKFFDRVHQDKLMHLVKGRGADRRVLPRIDRYRTAGAMTGDGFEATTEGTPQGGPLSPLRANLLLDAFDKELERRGHRFVCSADDSNIYVKSARAGQRVRTSVTRFLERRLHRSVNAAKRAGDRPWPRTFLGFPCTRRRPHRRQISAQALQTCKQERRHRTDRTRGASLRRAVEDLRPYLTGWRAYCGFAEVQSPCKEWDSWVRRRLRCDVWQQWGRRRYRELRPRGGSRDVAWNTCKSAHGPWRLSRSPALAIALPGRYFDGLGLPRLHQRPRH